MLSPFIRSIPSGDEYWALLAMISTYAGNLTLLGSVANLIVEETAQRYRIEISFGEYLKIGLVITILSCAIGLMLV